MAAGSASCRGSSAQFGFFRSRPNAELGRRSRWRPSSCVVVLGGIGYYGFLPFYAGADFTFFGDTSSASPFFVLMGYVIAIGFIAAIVGLIALLFVRRDVGVAYVAVAGLICGIVSAIISAPISAVVFGGVTGSGTDLLVAAFQQAGSDLADGRAPAGPPVRTRSTRRSSSSSSSSSCRRCRAGSSPASRRVRRRSAWRSA